MEPERRLRRPDRARSPEGSRDVGAPTDDLASNRLAAPVAERNLSDPGTSPSGSLTFCRNCGAELPARTAVCPKCGEALE
jgi:hypothetical protein